MHEMVQDYETTNEGNEIKLQLQYHVIHNYHRGMEKFTIVNVDAYL